MTIAALQPNKPASDPTREIKGGASMMIAYQLENKHVLIVGGGKEAANRTFFALDAGALVTLISPSSTLHPAVKARIELGLLNYKDRKFKPDDLTTPFPNRHHIDNGCTQWDVDMVLSCIDDHLESRKIAILARNLRIPVNCADIPDL